MKRQRLAAGVFVCARTQSDFRCAPARLSIWSSEITSAAHQMHSFRNFCLSVFALMASPLGLARGGETINAKAAIGFFESSKLEHPRSILGSDGAPSDNFGWSVSISGDVAVVGARNDSVQSLASSGSAYVFRNVAGEWQLEAKLAAFDAQPGQRFGWSVAVHQDIILVGAPHEGTPFGVNRGAVYVFKRAGEEWEISQKLFAFHAASGTDGAGGEFGSSIAFDGNSAVIGAELDSFYGSAQGAAIVFRYAGNQFNWDERLDNPNAADGDRFGSSVAVSGNSIIVGAPAADSSGAESGSAHVFVFDGVDWNLESNLLAPDGAGGDGFGASVAIAGDTALVGANGDDVNGALNQGSAHLFRRAGNVWGPIQVLLAADGAAGDGFGESVALQPDAAVVGAPNHVSSMAKAGAAFIFKDGGADWVQEEELGDDSGQDGDRLGLAVSMTENAVLVGAFSDDVGNHSSQGSARIFEFIADDWVATAQLSSGMGAPQANYGQSVSLSGNTILVSAPQDEGQSKRAVYVLEKKPEGWQSVDRWTPDAADPVAFFGYDTSIDGDVAIVGDCGNERALVYERQTGSWAMTTVLQAEDSSDGDRFGCAVAVAGDRIVIGAFEASHAGFGGQGAAYVFVRDSGIWTFDAKLVDDDLMYESFGEDVAVFGDTILVGAQGERKGPGAEPTGAVYVFEHSAAGWVKSAQLAAPDAESNKGFGDSVAIDQDYALIGAPADGGSFGQRRGAAYLFRRGQLAWNFTAKFTASDGEIDDWFGESVALENGLAVVGAPGHDLPGRMDSGSAYLFARSEHQWSALGKLLASDAAADATHGTSASISGGVVAVGAPGDDGSTIYGNAAQGGVYMLDFSSPLEAAAVFRNGFEP